MNQNKYDIHCTLAEVKNPSRQRLYQIMCSRKKELMAHYITGGKILEIGPGPGREFWPDMNRISKDIVSVDLNLELLEAQTEFSHIRRIGMDGCTMAFKPEVFDIVICFEVLEHVADTLKLLEEIKRVKKKEGLILLSTPSIYSPLEMLGKIGRLKGLKKIARLIYPEMIDNPGHISVMSNRQLKKNFKTLNLSIVEEDEVGLSLPLIAELLPKLDVAVSQFLEPHFHKNAFLRNFLWDQIFILK